MRHSCAIDAIGPAPFLVHSRIVFLLYLYLYFRLNGINYRCNYTPIKKLLSILEIEWER